MKKAWTKIVIHKRRPPLTPRASCWHRQRWWANNVNRDSNCRRADELKFWPRREWKELYLLSKHRSTSSPNDQGKLSPSIVASQLDEHPSPHAQNNQNSKPWNQTRMRSLAHKIIIPQEKRTSVAIYGQARDDQLNGSGQHDWPHEGTGDDRIIC